MKKYENPSFEIVNISSTDIITTSPGTSGPTVDEGSGDWGVGLGL